MSKTENPTNGKESRDNTHPKEKKCAARGIVGEMSRLVEALRSPTEEQIIRYLCHCVHVCLYVVLKNVYHDQFKKNLMTCIRRFANDFNPNLMSDLTFAYFLI